MEDELLAVCVARCWAALMEDAKPFEELSESLFSKWMHSSPSSAAALAWLRGALGSAGCALFSSRTQSAVEPDDAKHYVLPIMDEDVVALEAVGLLSLGADHALDNLAARQEFCTAPPPPPPSPSAYR